MILFWHIRYLDRADRQFKDRDLYLDTDALDAKTKASIELCYELNESGASRDMLKYRRRFLEKKMSVEEKVALCGTQGFRCVFFLHDYFEDERGNELTDNEIARILSGSETALAIPSWAQQHDINYMMAPTAPIQIDKIAASEDDLKVLGYFVRDLREMETSAFMKDGPGRLMGSQGGEPSLHTAVSDEGIRSFVTIFRRLYMIGEPASFVNAVKLFTRIAGHYPLVHWVASISSQYQVEMTKKPHFAPIEGRENWTFTRSTLLEVYIYTQYAHQPNAKRIRQFHECLEQVDNRKQLLAWLFLTELWLASVHIINAGRVIARVYDAYCKTWGKWPLLQNSISNDAPGLGQLETKENRRQRIFEAKVRALANQLWEERGRPPGGAAQFLEAARIELSNVM